MEGTASGNLSTPISSEVVNIQMIHVAQIPLQSFRNILGKRDEAKHSAAITNMSAHRSWL